MDEPVIAWSARKHGVADDDILHAWRNPIRSFLTENDMPMIIGPARNGALLEVGYTQTTEGDVIVHAMSARSKFLPRRKR